jgi:hypothetical protein
MSNFLSTYAGVKFIVYQTLSKTKVTIYRTWTVHEYSFASWFYGYNFYNMYTLHALGKLKSKTLDMKCVQLPMFN